MWLGYCAFHMGDYKRAMLEYEALTHAKTPPKVIKMAIYDDTLNKKSQNSHPKTLLNFVFKLPHF